MFRWKRDRIAGPKTAIAGPSGACGRAYASRLVAAALFCACGPGLVSPQPSVLGNDAATTARMDQSGQGGQRDQADDALPEAAPPSGAAEVADAGASDAQGPQTMMFPPAVGGPFDFGAGRVTLSSTTFDGAVTLSIATVLPGRPGPVGQTYQVGVSPRMVAHTPGRIRLRIPTDWNGDASTWQLAYFKPKPTDPPGLWIACQNVAPTKDERAIEGDMPGFDNGIEQFALLRRCGGGTACDPSFACISGLCQ